MARPEHTIRDTIGPRMPQPITRTPQEQAERRRRSSEATVHGAAGRQVARAIIEIFDGENEIELDAGTHVLLVRVVPK